MNTVQSQHGNVGKMTSVYLAVLAAFVTAPLVQSRGALAEIIKFQQGVSPTSGYSGCVDTFIRGSGWAHDRPSRRPTSQTLRVYSPGGALVRFDLAPIGKDRKVHKAVLRLYFAAVPSWAQQVEVYALSRQWYETATWYEYKFLDANKTDQNNWQKPGGDLDRTNFGKDTPGLVDRAICRSGPFGHIVELDVTPLVADWISQKRPNYGFFVVAKRGVCVFASSEWPLSAFRPELLVEHYGPGQQPAEVTLTLPLEPGPEAPLSPLASTPNPAESAGPTRTVRFGNNSNCQYRTGHMVGYAKQDTRYPGNWGWTPRLRVGGTAGDFNHALFYFNLSAIPKDATIETAKLRVFVDVGNMRTPAAEESSNQVPDADPKDLARRIRNALSSANRLTKYSFGLYRIVGTDSDSIWVEDEFTFAQRRVGTAWTGKGGTLLQTTEPSPVAICDVSKQWAALPKQRDRLPETWLEWDITGLVRAWVQGKVPNCGVVLDGRLMGGEMVLFSDDWVETDRRPYLEVKLSANLPPDDGEFTPEPLIPTGHYWVEPMKRVHARFKGIKGTFAQYGDSITVTMAFWVPLLYGQRKGITPRMQKALETARRYIHKPCWRQWKGSKWGNTGNMTIAWAFDNIDAWQERMNPEVAVILFGTNDASYGPRPPIYTEKYAAVVNRCLQDGTIPIVTTLPPRTSQRGSIKGFLTIWDLRLAAIAVAKAKRVPLIDLWAEMVKRRPDDWDGKMGKFDDYKGYDVPTLIARDGIHPSNPKKYRNDWTEQGLRCCGFALRNYLTLKMWYDVYENILANSNSNMR